MTLSLLMYTGTGGHIQQMSVRGAAPSTVCFNLSHDTVPFNVQAQEDTFNKRVYAGDTSKYVWFGVGTFGTQEPLKKI